MAYAAREDDQNTPLRLPWHIPRPLEASPCKASTAPPDNRCSGGRRAPRIEWTCTAFLQPPDSSSSAERSRGSQDVYARRQNIAWVSLMMVPLFVDQYIIYIYMYAVYTDIYVGEGVWRKCSSAALFTRRMGGGTSFASDIVAVVSREGGVFVCVAHFFKCRRTTTTPRGEIVTCLPTVDSQ